MVEIALADFPLHTLQATNTCTECFTTPRDFYL